MSSTPLISVVPQAADLALYAGDGIRLRLNVSRASAPLALTGAVSAQVRATRDATVSEDFSVDMSEAATGVVTLELTGAQTAAMITTSSTFRGVWDVQWTSPGEQPRTIVQGVVTCMRDVTRP